MADTPADALREELGRRHRTMLCNSAADKGAEAGELERLRAELADLRRELTIAVIEAGPDYVAYGHADRVRERYGIETPFRMPNVAETLHTALAALNGQGCPLNARRKIGKALGIN